MRARGSQMERLIEAAGGSTAENQRPSIYPTSGQMERLIAAMGGAPAEGQRPGKYPTTGQMERLIQAAGGAPAEDQLPGRYATSGQMERLIAAVGGEPAEDQVPGKYVTAGQMERLIQAIGSGGGEIVTVAGTTPLTLTNALARDIRSLVQQGKLVLDGDNIVCNNGVLRVVDDELPSGYKRITGIKFDGDFWYDTGEVLNGDDAVTMTLANTSASGQNVFGSYNGTASGAKNFSLYIYGGGSNSNSYYRYGAQLLRPKFGGNERTITISGNGTEGFTTDVTATPDTFTTEAPAYIGMLPHSSSAAYTGSIMGSIDVVNNGQLRVRWIPCERQSDGAVGYYELISGTFLEQVGTGTPIKGEYDTSHMTELITDGTPEVLTVGGANIWDEEWEYGRYDTSTGEPNNDYGVRSKNYIPVKSGETYRIVCGSITANDLRVLFYREDHSYIQATAWIYPGATFTLTGSTESAAYIKFFVTGGNYGTSYKNDIAINYPAAATEYAPYTTQTASVQNLFAVGTFRDEQDIITGKVTRRTVPIVYDGTQDVGEDYIGDLTEGSLVVYAPSETYSGAVAEFETAGATQMHSLTITLTPTQDLHGYDHPWPGGGGVNLLSSGVMSRFNNAKHYGVAYIVQEDGSVHAAGTVTVRTWNSSTAYATLDELGLAVGDHITVSCFGDDVRLIAQTLNENNTVLQSIESTGGVPTAAIAADTTRIRMYLYCKRTVPEVGDVIDKDIYPMISKGSAIPTAWTPYENICPITGHDSVSVWVHPTHDTTADPAATVQLGQTVYGGTLDVVSGEMAATMAMVDLGTLSWSLSQGLFYMTLPDSVSNGNFKFDWACDSYAWSGYNTWAYFVNNLADGQFGRTNNSAQKYVCFKNSNYSTVQDFKSSVDGTMFVYELDIPIIIQLTPTQISTILGQNRVWSDGGGVKVVLPVERIEYVDPQPLRTSEGSNTISVVSAVGEVELSVTYRQEGE